MRRSALVDVVVATNLLQIVLSTTTHNAASTLASVNSQLPEVSMTVPEIIEYYGYPCTSFDVTTNDGYILTMHRIPRGAHDRVKPSEDDYKTENKSKTKDSSRPVIFLQHGLIASSADFVTNLPHQSAGFVFADAGFDVFMGNIRGNVYSRKHVNLSTHSRDYWHFSFDEMAGYDLPAMIDAALRISRASQLYYVGHSQGTAIMFAKLATDDAGEFAPKIAKFFALAPVATVTHVRGLLSYLSVWFKDVVQSMFNWFGPREFLAHNWLTDGFAYVICGFRFTNPLCNNVLFQIGGPESHQFNQTRLLVYMEHTPAGTSTFNMIHWIQLTIAKRFQRFDFGVRGNIQHYGQVGESYKNETNTINMQPTAPVYNLTKIQTPTYLYYSPADWLATERDVKETILAEMRPEFVKRNRSDADFNHFDV